MRLFFHPEITGQPWCISFTCKAFNILLVSDLFWFMDSGALLIPQGILIVPLKMFPSFDFILFSTCNFCSQIWCFFGSFGLVKCLVSYGYVFLSWYCEVFQCEPHFWASHWLWAGGWNVPTRDWCRGVPFASLPPCPGHKSGGRVGGAHLPGYSRSNHQLLGASGVPHPCW